LSTPLLLDVNLQKPFKVGDRLLVKVSTLLSPSKKAGLIRTVEKFAGQSVRVLVLNCTQIQIIVQKGDEPFQELIGPRDFKVCSGNQLTLNCSAFPAETFDRAVVSVSEKLNVQDRAALKKELMEWFGSHMEILLL
jgi:hypothetical protein